jgi:hypothetical protein
MPILLVLAYLAVGALLAWLVILLGNPYFWELILPGSLVGVIIGYATQKHAETPRRTETASRT